MNDAKLHTQARRWRKKSEEFREATRRERSFAIECGEEAGYRQHSLDAARYEGEAIALRWCAEDLEKLLTKKARKK